MSALDILTEARDLIAQPYKWTKGHMHTVRTVKHEKVDCYCAVGAVRRAGGITVTEHLEDSEPPGGDYFKAITELNLTLDPEQKYPSTWRITGFNDTHKKREVVALFDDTIARLKEQT